MKALVYFGPRDEGGVETDAKLQPTDVLVK
jgi:hypothetical protein